MGAEHAKKRKEDAAASLFMQPPKVDEVKTLHQIFMDKKNKGREREREDDDQEEEEEEEKAHHRGRTVALSDTAQASTHWTHPQVLTRERERERERCKTYSQEV